MKIRDQVGELGVAEKIILMYLKEIGCEGENLVHLAQDRDHILPLVYMVTKLWVP
jgi:hypothetical protein